MPYKDVEKRRKTAKEWAKTHPERAAANSRKYLLKKRYSGQVPPKRFQEMFEAQNGKCAICGITPLENEKELSIDHDHTTGKVRALICNQCNLALGCVKENTIILENMINYINGWRFG